MHDRKQHVLLTAQHLFSEKGFLATSIQDILNASDISKGTFYNYFSSKNECLLAILENGREEVNIRRREVLVDQDPTSKAILAKQISIRLDVNREHNLLPIFQAIFHSGNSDLKAFVNKQQMGELSWLTNRLVDVYGDASTPFSPDFAVIMYGIMQHMMQSWRMTGSKQEINTKELVNFAMRRLDSIVDDMIKTNDIFLGDKLFLYEDVTINIGKLTRDQLLTKLTHFKKGLHDENVSGRQYSEFLINEIQADHPRVYLLESIIQSFRNTFIKTTYELEAREISTHVWSFIDTLEKDG